MNNLAIYRNVLAAISKRRLPAAASNRTLQTPAHAQQSLGAVVFRSDASGRAVPANQAR